MVYYLMNAVPRRARHHRNWAGFTRIMALKGGTLPVFTSLESFWDFGEVFYPETHELSPVPFEIGAFDLADLRRAGRNARSPLVPGVGAHNLQWHLPVGPRRVPLPPIFLNVHSR